MSRRYLREIAIHATICGLIVATVSYCTSPRAEQLITIRTTPSSLLECTAKMLKAGDPRALLGPVACAEWSQSACEVILPSGLAAALPLLILHGPEATFVHEIAHCVSGDYHNDIFSFIDKD